MSKHELTEKLKVLEAKIYDDKVDLNAINKKLEAAYDYEDELTMRQEAAKHNTAKLRAEFFIKGQAIGAKYTAMKKILDVFTGNFYTN